MNLQSTYLNRTLSILLALGLLLGSCAKDDEEEPPTDPQPTQEAADTFPTPSDADGTLVAIKTSSTTDTPIGPIVTVLGTAVAVFSDDGFATDNWISAGTVSCNTNDLTMNPNNSYVFDQISQTNPTGIAFNGDVQWTVSGGNGIPSIDHNANNLGFPGVGDFMSPDVVVKADGYTLTCDYTAGADSVIFIIGGVAKTLEGNATSCAFSSTELEGISTGSNIVQITPYVIAPTDFGDTRIYFVNETVITKSVTVQ